MKKFIFTCGDINGIGPEIAVKTINKISNSGHKIIFLCPKNVFEIVAEIVPPKFNFTFHNNAEQDFNNPEEVEIISFSNSKPEPGMPTKHSGEISFKAVRESFLMLNHKKADAVITSPISKYALSLAGIDFSGHTEMYAEWCSMSNFVMMFLSSKMNCALLTIHEPVKNVAKLLKKELIQNKIEVIYQTMVKDFGIKNPKMALLGLNPHAGENGRIGKEEEDEFKPAVASSIYRENISGVFVPDAFFANKLYEKFDVVIGAYHDQVLIPFKMLNFSSGVNYTAGLPIIRTSPDHGTAFDIAYKGIADESSMFEAFLLSERIIKNRLKWNIKK
ncbi:MAG: 4-hydroxythreonine-4-phosphate dehydrogenase PdxA [Ignavibacteria bacterium]